jgi:pyridoxamine 5'-phosphate oxidase family protein
MTPFTDAERRYLEGQRLARCATADAGGAPHVVPVGFQLSDDGAAIDVGGHDVANSKKWRDLKANPKVAIVIDDLETIDPWTPRGIEVRGIAELYAAGGEGKFGPQVRGPAWIRIVPRRVTSWGIEGHAFSPAGRRRSRSVSS